MLRTITLIAAAGYLAACAGTLPVSTTVGTPASPNTESQTHATQNKALVAGQSAKIAYFMSLNPDCTVMGLPTIRVTEPPAHGTVRIAPSAEYPGYLQTNQRYPCNLKPTRATAIFYTPREGFIGEDSLAIEVIFPSGGLWTRKYNLQVK